MDASEGLIRLFVGGGFVALGIVAFIRRRMRVGLGGGKSGGSPLLTLSINNRAAIVLGISVVIGGTLFGLSYIFYWLGDSLKSDFFYSIPSIGVLIGFAGIIVSPLLSKTPPDMIHDKERLIQINDKGDEAIFVMDEVDLPNSDP
jgi:hypothetical protein